MKQTLKIGALLLVVAALTTTGVAVALSDDGSSVFTAADETTVTDEPSTTVETTVADETPLRSRIIEWLAPLVDDGTITDDQAAAVADTLAEHLPGLRRGIVRGLLGLDEAADFLGITGRELVEALRDGSTLAEIAQANGVEPSELIDHLVGLVEEQLTQAVADGRITEDEKTEALADATQRITDLVNGDLERPFFGEGFGGPGGMGFRPHGGGMGCGPDGDDATDPGGSDSGA